jgi:hypothetical protein
MDSTRPSLTDFSPPSVKGGPRLILWTLLLAMTAVLILFPANLKYEFSHQIIPFLYVFDSFSWFAALYYVWLAVLLVLLFTRGGGSGTDWEKASLVVIFTLIFAGYNTLLTRGLAGDAFTPAGDIKNLTEWGHFTLASAMKYHGFPGFSLLGTGVCLITGLDITDYMYFFPFFQILTFSLLLYLLFYRLLKTPYLASLGALLVIQLDFSVATMLAEFHAGAFTPFCLLPAALLLFTYGKVADNRRWSRLETTEWLCLVFLLALFISHFVTSVATVLIILGIYILQKKSGQHVVTATLTGLVLLIPVIWTLAENIAVIGYLADLFPQAVASLTSGNFISEWLLPMQTTSYVGGRSYPWMMPPLYLGPLLLVITGGILGLVMLFKTRSLDKGEVIALGGLAGIVILAIILLFLGSLQESYGRALIYIGLFTTPIILWRVYYLKTLRKYAISLLVIIVFSLSLPAFLLNSKAVAISNYYPREIASGEFLESVYDDGSGLHIYGIGGSVYYLTYYLPHAYLDVVYPPDIRSNDAEYIWGKMNDYVSGIGVEKPELPVWVKGPSIVMFSPQWETPFRDYIGVDVKGGPEWRQLETRLAENDIIYTNSFVRIYHRSP